MSMEMIFFILATVILSYTLLAIWQRRRVLATKASLSSLSHYPSLTVIRPIRGLDPGAAKNIAAALDNGYPGEIDTIFVLDDEQEPALPLLRTAIAEHERQRRSGRAHILIAGPPQPGRTGKLNAMIAGMQVAQGQLIAFADSDIRPDRDALRRLVELLISTENAGAVFAPVTVSEPPQALGDVGYALMLNALYSPEVRLLVQRRGEVPFIMGQLMIFRRETLSAIGGLDCASGQLVDDMHIGACVTAAGLRNIMSTDPVRIIDWGMSAAEFARTYRRWLAFSRTGLPLSFWVGAAQPYAAFWLGLGGCATALLTGHPLAAVMPFVLMLAVGGCVLMLNRAAGGAPVPWHFGYAPYLLLAGGPFMFLAQLLWPKVRWRGRTYELNAQARLTADPSAR
jgi:ceramide glucosyltransferase